MKRALASIAVVLCALVGASAGTLTDNFESYAPGTFPSPTWLDVGTIFPSPGTPVPSATIVSTTDAFGHPTQALSIANAVSSSRGIYAPVAISSQYSLTADIRVDQYSNVNLSPQGDWAMELTFANCCVTNFAGANSSGIYASAQTQGWRLYVLANNYYADIDLGASANIGTWYGVSLQFDLATDTFHSRIIDVLTGNVLVDRFDVVAALNSANTQYNSIAFFGGELDPSTIANVAVVDNVNISATTPEPSTLLLIGSGLSLLVGRIRRR